MAEITIDRRRDPLKFTVSVRSLDGATHSALERADAEAITSVLVGLADLVETIVLHQGVMVVCAGCAKGEMLHAPLDKVRRRLKIAEAKLAHVRMLALADVHAIHGAMPARIVEVIDAPDEDAST